MSIQAVAWALDQDLPARPKLVLVSIANHASHTDGYCWLKAETIAQEAACTPRSVYTYIGGLVRNGFIRKSLRKGEDGKQRATDYWMLFSREPAAWDWGARPEPPEAEDEAIENASSTDDPQDIDEPHEQFADGENEAGPVDKHVFSCGPSEDGFRRERVAQPSKTKSEKDARARPAPPRHYRPPPPQPLGAVVADKQAKLIFVFEDTRAWEAWVKVKRRETGVSCWNLTTTAVIDGKRRSGWWFPSLFPKETGHDPPLRLSDEELREFK